MSPVFAHGQLRLYLLALLADGPRHGYEVIQQLEARFGGLYSPSAGTVYPRLAKLEEEGLVERTDEGRKATYRITDAGRAEVAARADELAGLRADIDQSVRRLAEQVRASVHGRSADLRAELKAAARAARASARPAGAGAAGAGPVLEPNWVGAPGEPPPPGGSAQEDPGPGRRHAGSWTDWLLDWPGAASRAGRPPTGDADGGSTGEGVPGGRFGTSGFERFGWAGPELERALSELREQARTAWWRHGLTPAQSSAIADIISEATHRIAEVLRQPPTQR